MELILASGSRARQNMLKSAGIRFAVMPADLNEQAIIDSHGDNDSDYAAVLAAAKAQHVAQKNPDDLVIGSDQILLCEGRVLSKAKSISEAREKLKFLRGKTHFLTSAVAVAMGDEVLWSYSATAHLRMHNFDDAFLDSYCDNAGDALTACVGAYEFEGLGAQLFEEIEGDYFTILGMPLLALLNYLRDVHNIGLGGYYG